jgi:hypothetical protein
MINLNHITAKGMPAMRNTHAAAGQRASMPIQFVELGSLRRSLRVAGWNLSAFTAYAAMRTAEMLGLTKPVSFGYAISNGIGGCSDANPPFRDNSSGKTRLKLR